MRRSLFTKRITDFYVPFVEVTSVWDLLNKGGRKYLLAVIIFPTAATN